MVKRCFGNERADCFTKSFATAANNFWITTSAKKLFKGVSLYPKKEGGNFGLSWIVLRKLMVMYRENALSLGKWRKLHCIGWLQFQIVVTDFLKQLLIVSNCSYVLSRFHEGMKPREEIHRGVHELTCFGIQVQGCYQMHRLSLKKDSRSAPRGNEVHYSE